MAADLILNVPVIHTNSGQSFLRNSPLNQPEKTSRIQFALAAMIILLEKLYIWKYSLSQKNRACCFKKIKPIMNRTAIY